MSASSQRAVKNYRDRLQKRGMTRFEVVGLASDRDLIRSLARRMAEDDIEAGRIRGAVTESIAEKRSEPGGILRALRNSPLVGADIDLTRVKARDRKVDL